MNEGYDHYIGVDWSIKNMAIARMTGKSDRVAAFERPAEIGELLVYLKSLRGSVALTIEESTTSQWLFTELRGYVARLLVCDPGRNRLLSEGSKTDRIDAVKLAQLLRAGLLKEVYHSSERFLELRRLVSGYEDLIKSGVRLKNQRYSLLRGYGLSGYEDFGVHLPTGDGCHVLESIERQIENQGKEKKRYEKRFAELSRQHPEIRHQMTLPGIGIVGAVKVVSRVVSPHRFPDRGHFLSYAGLVTLERSSGGVMYGRKSPRYSRELKSVYKTGVMAAIGGSNPINDYYEYLIREKKYPEHQARHKAARHLATLSWGVFKNGKPYKIKRENKNVAKTTERQETVRAD